MKKGWKFAQVVRLNLESVKMLVKILAFLLSVWIASAEGKYLSNFNYSYEKESYITVSF